MSHTTLTRLSATAALFASVALFATAAEAWPPGVAPPWANSATTSEAKTIPPATPTATSAPAPASAWAPTETTAAIPAAQPSQTADPSAAPLVAAGVTPAQGTTTPIRAVSLRGGPNSSFPVIGTLRPGDQLQILAKANYGWTQVQSPAGTGWAYGSYLAPGGTAAASPPPAPPSEATPQ